MLEELSSKLKGRVLVLGIGNELRGDDGAGAALAESLRGKVRAEVINGGEVPESYTGEVKDLTAETILLVDAVDMGEKPGSVSLIERDKLAECPAASTHHIPLAVLADYLHAETGAAVFLLAIQVRSTAFGAAISPDVEDTLAALKECFMTLLGPKSA
ncbi:MAG: hydrogenase 3 maturation endopeptidase HyCI [bacterium]